MDQILHSNHQSSFRDAIVDPLTIKKLDASHFAPFNDKPVKYKRSVPVEFVKSQCKSAISTAHFKIINEGIAITDDTRPICAVTVKHKQSAPIKIIESSHISQIDNQHAAPVVKNVAAINVKKLNKSLLSRFEQTSLTAVQHKVASPAQNVRRLDSSRFSYFERENKVAATVPKRFDEYVATKDDQTTAVNINSESSIVCQKLEKELTDVPNQHCQPASTPLLPQTDEETNNTSFVSSQESVV
jgi:hypothetical protein